MASKVLVVDDEALLALDIEAILEQAGYEVVGPAANVASAMKLIDGGSIDAAILDLNLAQERSDDIADRLSELSVPFFFLTGYSAEHLPPSHAHREMIRKPFRERQLLHKLGELLS
ncbi:response regulator [Sulfitobacter sp. D35]|uniref:response regulator n=1 Tax=Sulfitobacter sp. D35 TaxID=3083252 RepID=UPI00296ECAB9|nr:response regulator [Sulfitobacter sp. D35]MDW4497947.1 response regulator [Sulfitobacter sp. D35]